MPLLAAAPPPDPDTARRLLQRELARREYNQQSLLERFWDWFTAFWDRLNAEATGLGDLTTLVAVVVGVLVVAVLGVTLPRLRRERVNRRPGRGVLDTLGLSADELRARAEAAVARGDHRAAVADAVRALARRSVERRLLDDAPGRTTHEVLAVVAARVADLDGPLARGADLFDAVVYGGHPATAADSEEALTLEAAVRARRPVPSGGNRPEGPGSRLAVPR